MVKVNRGGSFHWRGGTPSSIVRFLSRGPNSPATVLLIIILFSFSFIVFVLISRNIFDEDPKSVLSNESAFESLHQPRLRSLSPKISDELLWAPPPSYGLHQCVKPTVKYKGVRGSDNYITVKSNGGLNQMRTGISDMVVIAYIMNATLVIPRLDKRSFWKDSSAFSDIFDELHFIESLKDDVRIVKELPRELASLPQARKHFTSWSGMGYYEAMSQLWRDFQVIHVAKSDSRVTNSDLPLDIQRLRCRALYSALRFSPPIEMLAKKLVQRLRSQSGRYMALHLRYEKDMLSFTGCTHGLSAAESEELEMMRESTSHWKVKKINSTEQRVGGFCPLTPREVGILLQALGYLPSTVLYIAAGEIYGGHSHVLELTSLFPNIIFKEMLAVGQELEAFTHHASQAAALDYIISVESDVFVSSYSGNMARAVEGHRRFLGHRKTISPNRKSFIKLLDKAAANGSGRVEVEGGRRTSFSSLVREIHKNRQGAPRKRKGPLPRSRGRERFRTEESFYENPFPECICKS